MRVAFTFIIFSILYCVSYKVERKPASLASDLVGIEATFTNDFFINHKEKNSNDVYEYIKKIKIEILKICDGCEVENPDTLTGYIKFADGFKFYIEPDTRVVEVTATPIPSEDLHIHKKKVDLLTLAARNVGLYPAKSTGGGHLHFDFHKFFGGDRQLVRDFFVDSYNNSFIFNSYFGGNALNAPTIDQLPESSHNSFIEVIKKFDRSPVHIMVFIRTLLQSVFSKTMYDHLNNPQKYHAISLYQALNGAGTIEFRNVRPYQQGDHIELITKAILARRDYLIDNPSPKLEENFSKNLDDKEKFDVFIKYLNQIGLDEKKYFPLLPKETISFSLERLSTIERNQYLVDFAKYTAFNDTDRQIALLESLRKIDDEDLQKRILYILLEKTNTTSHFDTLLIHCDDIVKKLGIHPNSFLNENINEYSMFEVSAIRSRFKCSETLSVLLR